MRGDALSEAEFGAWSGLIGHRHITRRKTDPGPAYGWDHLLQLTG